MKKESREFILSNCDSIFNLLFLLETILKTTKNFCLTKEDKTVYYDLSSSNHFALSEERNQYVSMLNIALEKLEEIKKNFFDIENKMSIL